MNSSETIKTIIAASYKQSRKEDDINQPLSVQPWGTDGRKRRYWLIEGQNDTSFRIYRQIPAKLVRETWWNVAGSLVELEAFANKLRAEDGSQAARRLADKMEGAIPRLLLTDEVCRPRAMNHPYFGSLIKLTLETQAKGVPTESESLLQATRARIFNVRRPNTWKAYALYLLGR